MSVVIQVIALTLLRSNVMGDMGIKSVAMLNPSTIVSPEISLYFENRLSISLVEPAHAYIKAGFGLL